MKPLEKRVSKLCEGMTNASRVRAVLDAIRADDSGLRDRLLETTPRRSYTAIDAKVSDTIEAAQTVSLRFDRTFFHLLASSFACWLPYILKDKTPKDVKTARDNMTIELLALTRGAEIFAERIRLTLDQVLAFSMVLDGKYIEHLELPATSPSDDDLAKANEVADAFQAAWYWHGNVIKDFGEAA